MGLDQIIMRLFFAALFSAIIGLEREWNNSTAGLRTHTLVGIGAALIALIQSVIVNDVYQMGLFHPEIAGTVRTDPARLISQVVSGIGFLGAGTIIVTKRNVTGLTTAASIWTVAAIGIACGMGYYEIAIAGFLFVIIILYLLKRFINVMVPLHVVVKYIGGHAIAKEITDRFDALGLSYERLEFHTDVYGQERIHVTTFEIKGTHKETFDLVVESLSQCNSIMSVQTTKA